MPRLSRWFVPGVPQHIIQRGNNRGRIFYKHALSYAVRGSGWRHLKLLEFRVRVKIQSFSEFLL
ncbi:MAG: hypothetical protein EXR11_11850 [Rhodospirillaceae bacterium]|nr:hypothetical protein [Rhodospirillaceae bacterium]